MNIAQIVKLYRDVAAPDDVDELERDELLRDFLDWLVEEGYARLPHDGRKSEME